MPDVQLTGLPLRTWGSFRFLVDF